MKIKVSSLVFILISALFVYSTCTFIRLRYNFYVAFFLYVVVFLLAWQNGLLKKSFFFHSSLIKWFVVLTCFSSLIYIHTDLKQWITFFASYIHTLFWILAFEIVAKNFTENEREFHLNLHIILMILWALATIRALIAYPLAARAMYGVTEEILDSSFLHSIGCGGYGFVYGLVFINIALFINLFSGKKIGTENKWYLMPIIIFIYTIIKAGFTTALIMLGLSLLLLFLYARTKKISSGILVLFVIFLFVFGFYQELINLIYAVGEFFEVDIVTNKMNLIVRALNAEDMSQLARFQNYDASWQAFLKNPLQGSGDAGIDSHILTQLAYMGIGGLTYIGFIHSAFIIMKKYVNTQFINIIEILIIFLTFFNTFNDMTSISVVFFLTPCLMLGKELKIMKKDEVINESLSD